MSGLAEGLAQVRFALAGETGVAVSSREVVAKAHAGPGGEMDLVGKCMRRHGDDLDQDGTGAGPGDARDGLEQVRLGLPGGNRRGDATVLVGNERPGVLRGLQLATQLAQRLGVQLGGERLANTPPKVARSWSGRRAILSHSLVIGWP